MNIRPRFWCLRGHINSLICLNLLSPKILLLNNTCHKGFLVVPTLHGNSSRTCDGKQVFFLKINLKIATSVDLNNLPKQLKLSISLYTYASNSELPSK